ncbi:MULTISPECIES: adenylate/guanylate cyclase domain-containing protein [Bacillus]|uniref:adenylate/guanylate cyclase domain-containing protein n=1 Tax=Bacillus TaxID=1386 RepID=UPI0010F596B9|nr:MULTISPECIES: adenylate/guanylate cyclase domain-containing protein [Bacillus]MCD2526303.1 adenylate/guanylate cyclase domain-containing protein [Bacillus licheniformis]TWN77114.1 hypothetical protein CHCC20494_1177 [Bacillus licheniformis]
MPKVTEEGLKKIEEKIETIFTTEMEVDDFEGDNVPSVDDLPDKNKGLIVTNCTILFVDIRSSTKLSDKSQAKSMAKIYRAFARAMSMCVYESGGRVRQIAGDRVMGVFVDDAEESSIQKAMDAARAITSVVEYIFNPLCRKNVNQKEIACGVGIDTGRILVTPIGIKHQGDDSRDLVWAGKTANVASKHTDLAEASEIFVTKRFYEKLPSEYKKNSDGSEIWTKTFRFKGDTLFEGYGVREFYLPELVEEPSDGEELDEKRATSSHKGIIESEGNDIGRIVTDIVQGVESKVGGLLSNFEQVVLREVAVAAKESQAERKLQELQRQEQAVKKKEEELKKKEQDIERILAYRKKELEYTVKVTALRERTKHMELEDFLIELKQVLDLGAAIGKKAGTVHNDLYVFRIVMYLHGKGESELAFRILIGQLTEDLPTADIPSEWYSVPVIKKVGREQEYLKAVNYHIQHYNPSVKDVLLLRNVLKQLGIENEIVNRRSLFIE